jgi:hypothetical protein
MAASRKDLRGGRAFAAPLFGIVLLMLCYWVLAEWPHLPALISSALGAVHWPV